MNSLRLNRVQYDIEYQRLIKPGVRQRPFAYDYHPVHKGNKNTLSWVRIDIDFTTNEALIEEVQMDWLRYAQRSLQRVKMRIARDAKLKPSDAWAGVNGSYAELSSYVNEVIAPYKRIWAEATLNAAMNSPNNTLITILVADNFYELK